MFFSISNGFYTFIFCALILVFVFSGLWRKKLANNIDSLLATSMYYIYRCEWVYSYVLRIYLYMERENLHPIMPNKTTFKSYIIIVDLSVRIFQWLKLKYTQIFGELFHFFLLLLLIFNVFNCFFSFSIFFVFASLVYLFSIENFSFALHVTIVIISYAIFI